VHLVELGFYCDSTCALCAQGRLRETESPGSFEALAAQVDRAPVHETLAFIGGEPTLFDRLVELVERARERGVSRIVVQTHARQLAEPGVAQRLAKAGVSSLDVSLSGDSEPVHDYHMGQAGSFRQTVLGIRRARAARLELGINVVVTRSNFRHLSGVVRVAHALGAQAVRLVLAQPLGAGRDNASRLVPDKRMVWPHLTRALELARTLGLASSAPDFELSSEHGVEHWFAGLGPVQPGPAGGGLGPGALAGHETLPASQPPSPFDQHTSPGAGW
jgi:MoaA/NifB/PqqE/SkfB family radical SAM enzyme